MRTQRPCCTVPVARLTIIAKVLHRGCQRAVVEAPSVDAGFVVAATRRGCQELLTEDLTNGQDFGSITVRGPLA